MTAIKLEGGAAMADRIKGIVDAGIPAIGHLGTDAAELSARWADSSCRAKSAALAKKIVDDAKALEEAGAFCILLELVPDRLCKLITERAKNCIIMSLGSGPDAHGQLLIYHDAFALYPKFKPRMAKVFADAGAVIREGLNGYVKEVTEKTFPAQENWFGMPDEEYDELMKMLDSSLEPEIIDDAKHNKKKDRQEDIKKRNNMTTLQNYSRFRPINSRRSIHFA